MKSYTKIFFVCAIILFFVSMVIAFDWPQSVAGTSEINKSFGELQGDLFNTSLIFSKAEEVQSTEAGQLMAILGQNSREMGWAPTTLGNAVILAHENEEKVKPFKDFVEAVKEIIFKTIKEKKYGKYKLHKRLRRSSLPHKI